jgi:hypothetical protein
MCTSTASTLKFYKAACACAGTGCGGHQMLGVSGFTPIGYQGAAQHTYTTACDGFHEPGQCPRSQQPHVVHI